jgi:hypothetical protein
MQGPHHCRQLAAPLRLLVLPITLHHTLAPPLRWHSASCRQLRPSAAHMHAPSIVICRALAIVPAHVPACALAPGPVPVSLPAAAAARATAPMPAPAAECAPAHVPAQLAV